MLAKGYLAAYKDRGDKRKRVLALSSLGKAQRDTLEESWKVIEATLSDLIESSEIDILEGISKVERALQEQSFEARFLVKFSKHQPLGTTEGWVRIVPYKPRYAADFKRINENWIQEFFSLEQADRVALDDPEGHILSKGGEILFAIDADENVVGTCALIRHSSEVAELAKMGVDKQRQSQGAGNLLGLAVLDLAAAKGFRKVFLETNSILSPAISLYRKLGFEQRVFPHASDYARADVYMERVKG